MRFVHELYEVEDVRVSVDTLEGVTDGFHVEVAIDSGDGPSIHIEGDARTVLRALEEAAAKIRTAANALIEEGELDEDWENVTAVTLCEDCAKVEAN